MKKLLCAGVAKHLILNLLWLLLLLLCILMVLTHREMLQFLLMEFS